MFRRKLKILFESEASYSNTGFGSYYKELISRLHATGKYRIAEHGAFGYVNDPRDTHIKWRFYANDVHPNDPRSKDIHSSDNKKLGSWRFNQVLLDFEPDIVIDLRDPHMMMYEVASPLRKYFYWIAGPTIDSSPQRDPWVDMLAKADMVLPYSEFGARTLRDSHPNINVKQVMTPGVNLEEFQPLDFASNRQKYGISQHAKIIGFVGRNQIRKLHVELMLAFKKFLESTNHTDAFLYLHTATPDLNGWNIPKVLIENNLQNKVFFSYICTKCQQVFPALWQGSFTTCRHCRQGHAIHPNVSFGCSKQQMCEIFNLMNLHVQYANCEGIGIPTLEAGACGVPTAGINHTAITDAITKTGGHLLEPLSVMRDINMDAYRAIPDNDLTAQFFVDFFKQSPKEQSDLRANTRKYAEENLNWDDISREWENIIDGVELTGSQGKWVYEPVNNEVIGGTNIYRHILSNLKSCGREDLMSHHYMMDIARNFHLHKNHIRGGTSQEEIDNMLRSIQTEQASIDNYLTGRAILPKEDYLEYAELKELSNA